MFLFLLQCLGRLTAHLHKVKLCIKVNLYIMSLYTTLCTYQVWQDKSTKDVVRVCTYQPHLLVKWQAIVIIASKMFIFAAIVFASHAVFSLSVWEFVVTKLSCLSRCINYSLFYSLSLDCFHIMLILSL